MVDGFCRLRATQPLGGYKRGHERAVLVESRTGLDRLGRCGARQPDIADIMLGAGICAAGEMDVDRAVQREACLQVAHQRGRILLAIGRGQRAARFAGAGDSAGGKGGGPRAQPERFDLGADRIHMRIGHTHDQRVLPDGEPDIVAAKSRRDPAKPAHLLR
nr:hypothetical protein [Aliiruegeria lutimaris]